VGKGKDLRAGFGGKKEPVERGKKKKNKQEKKKGNWKSSKKDAHKMIRIDTEWKKKTKPGGSNKGQLIPT